MTPSEELTSRYTRIEREADALGRVIGVRRLKVSQQVKVSEMTPSLEGNTEMTSEDGRSVRISRRSLPVVAASVCEIDGTMIPFARTRGELDAIMDRLDEEGLVAAVIAYSRFAPQPEANGAEGDSEDTNDLAKK